MHTLLSLQTSAGPPTQALPLHVSLVVHALPSLQGAVLLTNTQPVVVLQLSFVHPLLSLQTSAGPPTQAPPLHASLVVHALPSLQGAVLLTKTHPVEVLQPSLVHSLLSLQTSAGPPTQAPPLHVSLVVHALPSLQGAVLFTWTQPVAWLHESSVQPFPSLQFCAGPPTQTPPVQVNPPSCTRYRRCRPPCCSCARQPCTGSHESSVHALPSSQLVTHGS